MKKIVIVYLVWVVAILLINKLSIRYVFDRTSYELPNGITIPFRPTLTPFLNFDGRNYLDIAKKGYFVNTQGQNLHAFFPAYPFLIKIIAGFGINQVIAGLGISFLFSFLSVVLFYKLVARDYGEKIALKSVLLLLSFPTSFFLLTYYSESLFLFLTLLSFWFIHEKTLIKSSLLSSLASVTRFFGITLTPVLFLEAYKHYKLTKVFPTSIFIAPLGFIIYFGYSFLISKNGTSFVSTYSAWGRNISLFGPIEIYIKSFQKVLLGVLPSYDSPFVYPVIIIEFLSLLLITYLTITSFRKIKNIYWVYILFSFLIILFVSYSSSIPRYLLTIFPIYIFLGKMMNGWRYSLTICIFIGLFIFLSGLFFRGYWVS